MLTRFKLKGMDSSVINVNAEASVAPDIPDRSQETNSQELFTSVFRRGFYWESQTELLCLEHALNMLLQKNNFSKAKLVKLSKEI